MNEKENDGQGEIELEWNVFEIDKFDHLRNAIAL